MSAFDTIPESLRGLRACIVCSLVKTANQFESFGCENCERFLMLKGDIEKVHECTSANFDGIIAACDQNDSWVCKWQSIDKKCKGIYALSVSGSLPKHVITELKALGFKYRPNQRDKSVK